MSSLIFDEGASLKPAKTPHHDGLKTARKAALGSALPTPATHKLKPQTTAKRVLFGDITKGAANNATVRKADGGVDSRTDHPKKDGPQDHVPDASEIRGQKANLLPGRRGRRGGQGRADH